VIGGGQFPTYHGYNPTQTIQALAYMTADRMLDRPLMSPLTKGAAPSRPDMATA
jgi:choline dehydrogenase-like flavoprotein